MTENELLDALREALAGPDVDSGAVTTPELAARFGLGIDTIRRKLRPLLGRGIIEPCRKDIVDMAGRTTRVPAYRLKA